MYLSPIGLVMCFLNPSNASVFLILYGFVSYYFAQKMNRLIILMGPIAAALSGIALANMVYWIFAQLQLFIPFLAPSSSHAAPAAAVAPSEEKKKLSAAATPLDKAKHFYRSSTGKTVNKKQKTTFVVVLTTTTTTTTTTTGSFCCCHLSGVYAADQRHRVHHELQILRQANLAALPHV
jgi:hypothetical protein